MIIKKDPNTLENPQQSRPPPPSYTEVNYPQVLQPELAHPSSASYQYPPNTRGPSDPPLSAAAASRTLTAQERRVQIGQQYREELLARCAEGHHEATTTFGICGIICAILLFPIGLICLCIDTESKCSRCGERL